MMLSFWLQAAYIRVPQSARQEMAERSLPFREGLHAASHALINVVPLFLLCNATDLGSECDNPYDTRFRPERLLIFDKHPGGIGLAKQVAISPCWEMNRASAQSCSAPPVPLACGTGSCHLTLQRCLEALTLEPLMCMYSASLASKVQTMACIKRS